MSAGRERRVLAVSPFPPRADASQGGARALGQWLRAATEHHRVGLLCFRAGTDEPVDRELLERCAFVHEVERAVGAGGSAPWTSLRVRARRLGRLIGGTPPWPAKFAQPGFADALARDVRRWRPHVVEAHFHLTAQHLGALDRTDALRVFVSHEPGVDHARAAAAGRGGLRRMAGAVAERRWRRFERRLVDLADAVVTFSERDRRALEGLGGGAPVVRVPLGIDIPARPLDPVGAEPPRLLFVGSFAHAPNVHAAVRLATAIFPALRARHPRLGLALVGPEPPARVRASAGAGIEVPGRVPDVGPWLDAASVVAVPLRHGGGTRIKVLEALAAGKAVVASPLALEGIDAPVGTCVIPAERDEDFVREIDALLVDPTRRAELGARARAWAVAHLGWERSLQAQDALYTRLLDARSPALSPPVAAGGPTAGAG